MKEVKPEKSILAWMNAKRTLVRMKEKHEKENLFCNFGMRKEYCVF